jgi:hypothetical protein
MALIKSVKRKKGKGEKGEYVGYAFDIILDYLLFWKRPAYYGLVIFLIQMFLVQDLILFRLFLRNATIVTKIKEVKDKKVYRNHFQLTCKYILELRIELQIIDSVSCPIGSSNFYFHGQVA